MVAARSVMSIPGQLKTEIANYLNSIHMGMFYSFLSCFHKFPYVSSPLDIVISTYVHDRKGYKR